MKTVREVMAELAILQQKAGGVVSLVMLDLGPDYNSCGVTLKIEISGCTDIRIEAMTWASLFERAHYFIDRQAKPSDANAILGIE